MRRLAWIGLALATACATPEAEEEITTPPPDCTGAKCDVFGIDDRREVWEFPAGSVEWRLALSSAVLVRDDQILDGRLVAPRTLGEWFNLCEGERFREQPVVGRCSATLVAEDLVLTSGHCLMAKGDAFYDPGPQNACGKTSVVFGFAYDTPASDVLELRPEDRYTCTAIVAGEWTEAGEHDYAILKLDRPVIGRLPVKLRAAPAVEPGERVVQIGHPLGIPQKLAYGWTVEKYHGVPGEGFAYEADIFAGNSGGGVFDLERGALIGVPSAYSGHQFTRNEDAACSVSEVCGDGVTCFVGAYDTVTMLPRLPDEVRARLTIF